MGVPTSEVGYTSAMPRRKDHEVNKGHVAALGGGIIETDQFANYVQNFFQCPAVKVNSIHRGNY